MVKERLHVGLRVLVTGEQEGIEVDSEAVPRIVSARWAEQRRGDKIHVEVGADQGVVQPDPDEGDLARSDAAGFAGVGDHAVKVAIGLAQGAFLADNQATSRCVVVADVAQG